MFTRLTQHGKFNSKVKLLLFYPNGWECQAVRLPIPTRPARGDSMTKELKDRQKPETDCASFFDGMGLTYFKKTGKVPMKMMYFRCL